MTRAEIVAAALDGYGKESASVLGKRLGITKNAVVGIWNRSRQAGQLGTMGRTQRIALWEKGRSRVLEELTGAARATYEADRPKRTCRWPIGDPRDDSFRFCGEVVEHPVVVDREGQSRVQPYCEACRGRAFQQRAERFRPAVLAHAAFSAPRWVKPGALRFGRGA